MDLIRFRLHLAGFGIVFVGSYNPKLQLDVVTSIQGHGIAKSRLPLSMELLSGSSLVKGRNAIVSTNCRNLHVLSWIQVYLTGNDMA